MKEVQWDRWKLIVVLILLSHHTHWRPDLLILRRLDQYLFYLLTKGFSQNDWSTTWIECKSEQFPKLIEITQCRILWIKNLEGVGEGAGEGDRDHLKTRQSVMNRSCKKSLSDHSKVLAVEYVNGWCFPSRHMIIANTSIVSMFEVWVIDWNRQVKS